MDKDNLYCSFCDSYVSNDNGTFRSNYFSFTNLAQSSNQENIKDKLWVQALKCPKCKEITIDIVGEGSQFENQTMHFYPQSLAKKFPDYIPDSIRNDYEEAYAILELSPKASATLSRRCLQGMVRDFWKVSGSSLFSELDQISDRVEPSTVPVLSALRQLGNIGAHPEKDVNLIVEVTSDEAKQLLRFIELLMKDWYISKHEKEELLKDILEINNSKQGDRKKSSN